MHNTPKSPYRVPFQGDFKVRDADTAPPKDAPGKKDLKAALAQNINDLAKLQDVLYAQDSHAVLLIFQAMDAAGKDSTIRAVTSGINPAGFQVFAFKRPSAEELDHDFLWRTNRCLPERGRIGIFNRSWYEETLVARVHPELLDSQKLPPDVDREHIWEHRFESIREHERHLARNGTVILKFWLNVSRREQLKRFVKRIEDPTKNWKFEANDVKESRRWDDYMAAYQDMLRATSRPWAPWYAIPADDKPYMRWLVSDIVRQTLQNLPITYPTLSPDAEAHMKTLEAEIRADLAKLSP